MRTVFEAATNISTPLMLAGFLAAAFFLILRQILLKNVFPTLTRQLSGDIIKIIIERLFTLALVALVLGFAGFVLKAVPIGNPGGPSGSQTTPPESPTNTNVTADRAFAGLPAEQQRQALQGIHDFAALLDGRVIPPSFDRQAWSTSQLIVGLQGLVRIDPVLARDYLIAEVGPASHGWRKFRDSRYPPNLAASAWAVLALSRLGQAVPEPQLRFLLDAQLPDGGGWPIFEGIASPQYTSTYATALCVHALHSQLERRLITDEAPVRAAVTRGLAYLRSAQLPGRARWPDYPGGTESISISGLVLHVLHVCGGPDSGPDITALLQSWLASLPTVIPSATIPEMSNRTTRALDGSRATDDTRWYVLQWAVIATVDAYPKGTPHHRAAALTWIGRVLAGAETRWGIKGTDEDDWVAAEMLVALRHLAGQ